MKKINRSLLTPPGNGVFTVHTAKERKLSLWEKIYKQTDDIETVWNKSIDKNQNPKTTTVLGICSDCGGGILRGANWGPLFLRLSFMDHVDFPQYFDLGDIKVIPHLLHDKYLNDQTIRNCRKALYQDENTSLPVSPLSIAEHVCDEFYQSETNSPLFALGGDHSVSYPLVKSYLKNKKAKNKKAAIIHFDAHTDLLETRLGIDLCFGSWVTHILDDLEEDELVIQLGIRSTGKDRDHWEKTKGVLQFWSDEIKHVGINKIVEKLISHLKKKHVDELYVSVDIDALDSNYAAATGTPEKHGLSPDEIISIIAKCGEAFPITGADLVEVAPFTKAAEHINPEPDSTLLSASLIAKEIVTQLNKSCLK